MSDDDGGMQWYAEVGAEQFYPARRGSVYTTRSIDMNIDEFSQSKYLAKKDFPKPALLTISRASKENVAKSNEPKKERCIIYFDGLEKGMVFNKTNLTRAAFALQSEDTDDWIGKKIIVYFDDEVEFGGEIVGGLRVRKPKNQPEPYKPKPQVATGRIEDMDSDIPF